MEIFCRERYSSTSTMPRARSVDLFTLSIILLKLNSNKIRVFKHEILQDRKVESLSSHSIVMYAVDFR